MLLKDRFFIWIELLLEMDPSNVIFWQSLPFQIDLREPKWWLMTCMQWSELNDLQFLSPREKHEQIEVTQRYSLILVGFQVRLIIEAMVTIVRRFHEKACEHAIALQNAFILQYHLTTYTTQFIVQKSFGPYHSPTKESALLSSLVL